MTSSISEPMAGAFRHISPAVGPDDGFIRKPRATIPVHVHNSHSRSRSQFTRVGVGGLVGGGGGMGLFKAELDLYHHVFLVQWRWIEVFWSIF